MLKAQTAILHHVLPSIQQAADELIAYMADEDDDDEIRNYLSELSVETLLDELVKLLTRDPNPVSDRYILLDVDDINIGSLVACYDELQADKARRWYASQMEMTSDEYAQSLEDMPKRLRL